MDDWEERKSSRDGQKYVYSASRGLSLWREADLPSDWAVDRKSDGACWYVHLKTGERTQQRPFREEKKPIDATAAAASGAPSGEEVRCGRLLFRQVAPTASAGEPSAPEWNGHALVTSVFRLGNAYRDSTRYAQGLRFLAAATRSELPGFRLVIFTDGTTEPGNILKQGYRRRFDGNVGGKRNRVTSVEDEAATWEAAWAELLAMPHVRVVKFRCPDFEDKDFLGGHLDLFGTMVRFFPLFAWSEAEAPVWARAARPGHLAVCVDADYHDYGSERLFLQSVAWYSQRAVGAGPELGLLALSYPGTTSVRHQPHPGHPPFIANAIAVKQRFPPHLFSSFLDDCARGVAGSLGAAGAYAREVHASLSAGSHAHTYKRRCMSNQTSIFPFGVDELFFTRVVSSGCRAAPGRRRWQFVVVSKARQVLREALAALARTLAKDVSLLATSKVLRALLWSAALMTGDPSDMAACSVALRSVGLQTHCGGTPADLPKLWTGPGARVTSEPAGAPLPLWASASTTESEPAAGAGASGTAELAGVEEPPPGLPSVPAVDLALTGGQLPPPGVQATPTLLQAIRGWSTTWSEKAENRPLSFKAAPAAVSTLVRPGAVRSSPPIRTSTRWMLACYLEASARCELSISARQEHVAQRHLEEAVAAEAACGPHAPFVSSTVFNVGGGRVEEVEAAPEPQEMLDWFLATDRDKQAGPQRPPALDDARRSRRRR